MNTEWAIHELDKFILATELVSHLDPDIMASFPRESNEVIAAQAHVAEQIMNRGVSKCRTEVGKDSFHRWGQHREAAVRARAQLVLQQEIDENLGENAPELSVAELYPWIWEGAKSLSPSVAAAIVAGRSANGRTEWLVQGAPRTYGQRRTEGVEEAMQREVSNE